MSAKDLIHDAIRNALVKDGWIVTHDPLTLEYEGERIFIDLGAERLIAAVRGDEKIAVEVKSFVGRSMIHDLEVALGQYIVYLSFLRRIEPERTLYVGISDLVYDSVFQREAVQMLVEDNKVSLLIVDVETEEVIKWIRN